MHKTETTLIAQDGHINQDNETNSETDKLAETMVGGLTLISQEAISLAGRDQGATSKQIRALRKQESLGQDSGRCIQKPALDGAAHKWLCAIKRAALSLDNLSGRPIRQSRCSHLQKPNERTIYGQLRSPNNH